MEVKRPVAFEFVIYVCGDYEIYGNENKIIGLFGIFQNLGNVD